MGTTVEIYLYFPEETYKGEAEMEKEIISRWQMTDCTLKYAITNSLINQKKVIKALIRTDMSVYALRPVGQVMNGLISSCQEAKSPELQLISHGGKKHQFYVKMIEDPKQIQRLSVLDCEFPVFDRLAGKIDKMTEMKPIQGSMFKPLTTSNCPLLSYTLAL